MTLPAIGSYVKIRMDAPNRDWILKQLRGAYGTSTKRAFKVLGYDTTSDKKGIELIVENVWGTKDWINADYVEPLK